VLGDAAILLAFLIPIFLLGGYGTLVHLSRLLTLTKGSAFARILRNNLLDVLGEDYIRTAHAKGLTPRRVLAGHGLVKRAALATRWQALIWHCCWCGGGRGGLWLAGPRPASLMPFVIRIS
jgi:hypothetical protein